MVVRAKMRCIEVSEHCDVNHPEVTEQKKVRLQAVFGDDADNKSWSKYTPWGEVTLGITNPEAYGQFKLGKVYFVDFNEVEEPAK